MKISSKPKDKKKDLRDFCSYCSKSGHIEEKCYYKYPKCTSQNFWKRFKNQIEGLQSKANANRSYINVNVNINNTFEHFLSKNQGFIVQTKRRILATGRNDNNWYFNNAVLYHMAFNVADFEESELTKCKHLWDNITLADGSTILLDKTDIVLFFFGINE